MQSPAMTRKHALGAGFGRLGAAATAGDLGDGVGRVAIALFAVGLTGAMVNATNVLWTLARWPAAKPQPRWPAGPAEDASSESSIAVDLTPFGG